MNKYHLSAQKCDELAKAFLQCADSGGNFKDDGIAIIIYDNNRRINVDWNNWEDLLDIERSELMIEAYQQAFGLDAAAKLVYAEGRITKK